MTSIVFSVLLLLLLFFTTITSFFAISTTFVLPALDPDELIALEKIATTLGVKGLNLSYGGDPCRLRSLKMMMQEHVVVSKIMKNEIGCDYSFNNNKTCHITSIKLNTLSLPGKLPPELAKLQYLQLIDLCLNYLSGTIPMEWASMSYLTSMLALSMSLSLCYFIMDLQVNLNFLAVRFAQSFVWEFATWFTKVQESKILSC